MAKDLGLANIRDIEDHFMAKIAEYLEAKGMKMQGWQEISIASDGKPNPNLQKYGLINHCWHSDSGRALNIASELVAAGFPVILSNVEYFYVDMSYNAHQSEPGLYWGGFVDEFQSFSMDPSEFVPLNSPLVLGLQAQLWRESIQGFDKIQRSIFPKIFGLVERAWNSDPRSLSVQTYNNTVNARLNALEEEGLNYRIAQPGIKFIDGKLHINCPIKAAEVYYTTDGSEPTKNSTQWTAPIDCGAAAAIKAKAFYEDKESVTTLLCGEIP